MRQVPLRRLDRRTARRACRRPLDLHGHRIEVPLAIDLEQIVRQECPLVEQDLLDLRREDVDAANDQHVVVAAKSVILATGGIGRLHIQGFPTSNHYGATGDGTS